MAMRAVKVADYCIAKYQAKAQEVLGPTLQRGQEQSEAEAAAADDLPPLAYRARQRVKRLIN